MGKKFKEITTHSIWFWRRHTATPLSSTIFPITTSHLQSLSILFSLKPCHSILSYFFSTSKTFPAKLVFYSHCTQRSTPPTHPFLHWLQSCCPRTPHSPSLQSCQYKAPNPLPHEEYKEQLISRKNNWVQITLICNNIFCWDLKTSGEMIHILTTTLP